MIASGPLTGTAQQLLKPKYRLGSKKGKNPGKWVVAGRGRPGSLPSMATGLHGSQLGSSWGMACGESELKCQGQKGWHELCRCITKDAFSRQASKASQRDGPDLPCPHLSLPLNSQCDHLFQRLSSSPSLPQRAHLQDLTAHNTFPDSLPSHCVSV